MSDTVQVHVQGVPLDTCQVLMPLEIVHGRSGVVNQPDAPTCSFTWDGDTAPVGLGESVQVFEAVAFEAASWADPDVSWADPAALWGGGAETLVPRFAGYVDSLTAQELGGPVVGWGVACVGFEAALGYRTISISRPAELDTVRVVQIGLNAGIAVTPVGDPGITLAAQVYEDVDALSALHEVCASTGGLLWQDRAGNVLYGTAHHREHLDARTLECDVISDGLEWQQSVDDILNDVTAKWATGETTFTDTASTAQIWGTRHADVTTTALAEEDAEQLAQLILRRRAWPYWSSPSVLVYADALDKSGTAAVAGIEVSSGVLLPLPIGQPGPVPSDLSLGVVEGWVETWDTAGHTIQYAVSDAARWNDIRLRTWAEVATETWAYWAAGDWSDQLIREPGDPV